MGVLGKYLDACKKFRKAVDLKPDYHEAYYNWGIALFSLEEYEQAREKLEMANVMNPDSSDYALACVYAMQQEIEKCEEYLRIASEHGMLPTYEQASKAEYLGKVRDEAWFKELKWAKPKA